MPLERRQLGYVRPSRKDLKPYSPKLSLHLTSNLYPFSVARSSDCNAFANNNVGCGTSFSSFGSRFNANGGGYFAMKRSAREGISVFFWPRNDLKVPPEVAGYTTRNNGQKEGVIGENVMIEESVWGLPQARFPKNEGCVIERFFDEHRIVFDLTFCVRVPRGGIPYLPLCLTLSFRVTGLVQLFDLHSVDWGVVIVVSLS